MPRSLPSYGVIRATRESLLCLILTLDQARPKEDFLSVCEHPLPEDASVPNLGPGFALGAEAESFELALEVVP